MNSKILTPLEVLEAKEHPSDLPDFVIRTFNEILVNNFKLGNSDTFIDLDVLWNVIINKSPFARISTKRQSYMNQLYRLASVHWNIIVKVEQGSTLWYISPKGAEWLF